jgi:hypothetical protein
MSDAVKLALIGMVGSLFTTIGIAVVAYFQYGQKKTAKDTAETVRQHAEISRETNAVVTETKGKVEAVHEQTNGRLLRAEAEVAALKAENDRLRAEAGARRKEDAP